MEPIDESGYARVSVSWADGDARTTVTLPPVDSNDVVVLGVTDCWGDGDGVEPQDIQLAAARDSRPASMLRAVDIDMSPEPEDELEVVRFVPIDEAEDEW